MKKLLLLGFIASATLANAQVLESDDFNSLTLGNITTVQNEIGQGGFYTALGQDAASTTTNLSEDNFKIIESGIEARGKICAFTGNNGDLLTSYMWKAAGMTDAWGSRTEGNDILEFSVDINPGTAGTGSYNTFGFRAYDADFNTIAGIIVNVNTFELTAFSGNNEVVLDETLAPNEWTKITMVYYPNGEVFVKLGDSEPIQLEDSGIIDAVPTEIDFESGVSNQDNAIAVTALLDNYTANAVKEASFLSVKNNNLAVGSKVYPNPTTDILNVSLENKTIEAISITDLNGRIVKSKNYGNVSKLSMSVSDLAAGIYMMNITSDKGTFTKKIIKN